MTSFESILILSYHLRLCLPKGFFPSGIPTKTLYAFLKYSMCVTYPAQLSYLDLKLLIMLSEEENTCMRTIEKVKNVCAYSPRTCFVAADHWLLVFSMMLKIISCSYTSDHVTWKYRDSCGHGCVDWESRRLWCERCYSFSAGRWSLRLSCRKVKLSRLIVLLHDKACPHVARQTQAFLHEHFHWSIFELPHYSLDLAPSDFFLFPKMKEHVTGKSFANDEVLKNAIGGLMVWRGYTQTGAKAQVPYCQRRLTFWEKNLCHSRDSNHRSPVFRTSALST